MIQEVHEDFPSLEKSRRSLPAENTDVVPVSCEILSDICTPIEALRILKNVSTHCYHAGIRSRTGKMGTLHLSGL